MFRQNFQNKIIFLFLLTGCKDIDPCFGNCLLPGKWSGEVFLENSYFEISTEMHVQLFKENDLISGWFYHKNGKYQIQEEYSILPCDGIWIDGDLEFEKNNEISISCLKEHSGKSCLDLLANNTLAQANFYNFYIDESFILDNYEKIDTSNKEEFICLD